MSQAEITAAVRRKAQLRMGTFVAWGLFSTAYSWVAAKYGSPAVLAWVAMTTVVVYFARKHSKAIDARLEGSAAITTDGYRTTAALAAKTMTGGQGLICLVAALFTYGFVGQLIVAILGIDKDNYGDSGALGVLPFLGGLAAGTVVWRLCKRHFTEGAATIL